MELEPLPWRLDIKKTYQNSLQVYEKNENSDLISVSNPPTQEFFEKVFSPDGPFWSIYSELGFASKPIDAGYVSFIKGQMFFLKNTEDRYMNTIGPEETYRITDGGLVKVKKKTLQNLLLLLASPFDAAKQQAGVIELGFLANEAIKEFEECQRKAVEYHGIYSHRENIEDPVKVAREALKRAVHAMRYTNLAMLSYTLNVRLRKTEVIDECEAQKLKELIEGERWGEVMDEFGYHSLIPYDITKPRFREGVRELEEYGAPEPPQSYALKWRENAKHLCSRYLDIERTAYEKLGEQSGMGELVYYLRTDELENPDLEEKAEMRRKIYERYGEIQLPARIVFFRDLAYAEKNIDLKTKTIRATSVSSEKTVTGPAVNINDYDDYGKCADGSIIVSKTLSPNLTILYRKAAAVVSEGGGRLAHAAIIAREMEIPCLTEAKFPVEIRDGQHLQVNGKTGEIKILSSD
jgi:phosphohistidine swiveling domain-containing protein